MRGHRRLCGAHINEKLVQGLLAVVCECVSVFRCA